MSMTCRNLQDVTAEAVASHPPRPMTGSPGLKSSQLQPSRSHRLSPAELHA